MLILSKKVNEKLIVGDDVQIKIIDVVEKTVVLGIQAPREFTIFLEEIHSLIRSGRKRSKLFDFNRK